MARTLATSRPRRLLAGLLVAAAFLALVEGALRLALGPPQAAIKVHAALGEHDRYFKAEAGWGRATYGDVGRPPFALADPTPRFAALGGSTVHGGTVGADFDTEFPHLAAGMLGVQAINLGSPGLDSHDLVRILDELEGLRLDALVVYTGHNDFGNAHFEGRYGDVSSALGAHLHAALSRLQTSALLSRALRPATGGARRGRAGMVPTAGEVRPLDPARQRVVLSGLRANLERLAWISGDRGWPLVVVVPVGRLTQGSRRDPCDRPGCPAELIEQAGALAESDPQAAVRLLQRARDGDPVGLRAPTAAQDAVRALGARHDHVTVVDAFAALPRDPRFDAPAERLFSDPVHLSRQGHRHVAALVAVALEPAFGRTAALPDEARHLRTGEPPPRLASEPPPRRGPQGRGPRGRGPGRRGPAGPPPGGARGGPR